MLKSWQKWRQLPAKKDQWVSWVWRNEVTKLHEIQRESIWIHVPYANNWFSFSPRRKVNMFIVLMEEYGHPGVIWVPKVWRAVLSLRINILPNWTLYIRNELEIKQNTSLVIFGFKFSLSGKFDVVEKTLATHVFLKIHRWLQWLILLLHGLMAGF